MADYEIVSGLITKVGRREAELVLSSVKISNTLLTNVHVWNQGFFDLIEKNQNLVIGYRKSTFSNFSARLFENLALDKKSAYERQMYFNRNGRDVGKNEKNTVFYIKNIDTNDEMFSQDGAGTMKYSKRILIAGIFSLGVPYIQFFGIFIAIYIVFFSKILKDHYEKIKRDLRSYG